MDKRDPVDTISVDFQNTFDKFPHQTLSQIGEKVFYELKACGGRPRDYFFRMAESQQCHSLEILGPRSCNVIQSMCVHIQGPRKLCEHSCATKHFPSEVPGGSQESAQS